MSLTKNRRVYDDILLPQDKDKPPIIIKAITRGDLKRALGKIVVEINEGIKYGSLSGINNYKKELIAIINKHLDY